MSDAQHNLEAAHLGTDIDLRQFLQVIIKRRNLIIVLTLVCALGAGIYSYYVLTPVYEAKALLMVTVASDKLQTQTIVTRQVTQNGPGTTVANSAPMPVLTMNTYLGQLESEVVMKRVLESIDLPGQTIGSLSAMVDASIVTDSNLIELKVENSDPVMAAAIANAISDQYLELMKELMFSSVVVISPANVPISPVKPNKKLNIVMGIGLGIILSSMLAFLLEYMNNTLKTASDVDRELNLPVLGLIPISTNLSIRQNTGGAK